MNANDVLAQLVGITPITPTLPVQDEEEDENGKQYEDDIYDDDGEEPEPDMYETDHDQPTTKNQRRSNPRGRSMLQRELQGLQFRNPGDRFLLAEPTDIINPNRSRRQRTEKQTEQKQEDPIRHDASGALSVHSRGKTKTFDLCDCLNTNCNGCHWPCKTCKSTKCFVICRQGRKDMVVEVEEMYTMEGASEHVVAINPHFPYPIKD